jgi:hypothetical protein
MLDPKLFELSLEHLVQNAKAKANAPKVKKPKKRPQHFSMVPMALWERLSGAPTDTLAGRLHFLSALEVQWQAIQSQ